MDITLIFLFAGIIIIAAVLLALMSFGKKGAKHLNVEQYRVKYLEIENNLDKDKPTTFYMAVLNADKLLDMALKEKGIRGETMGERMKNAGDIFRDKNGVWSAHKLRNRIAHESDAVVGYNDARYALACFKKALKDLGAI
jgi:hypothetical protein